VEECRWLSNRLREERTRAWEACQASPRLSDQHALLPALKAERPTLARVQSPVVQNVAVRLDLAFKAFFRRVQAGETPGSPRFRGVGRSDSFTFPQVPLGCHLDAEAKRLRVMNVGLVKLVLHRPLAGAPKTATIQRSSTGKWSVCCSGEGAEPSPLPPTGQHVGLDVGLSVFALPTPGEPIANPRYFRRDERALRGAQRRLSKAEPGTPERATRRWVVARLHEHIAWRRGDFAHPHSRRLVNTFDLLAVEDLSVKRMLHNHCLAKRIADAAWTQFAACLAHKAAGAGRRFVAVNPAYPSQDCSRCGHRPPLSLSDRVYQCPCGELGLDRDRNAARNILRHALDLVGLGQQSLAQA
jgi:putative transposase